MIGSIIFIVILLIIGLFWFIAEWNSKDEVMIAKCVPDSCCHSMKCVPENQAPNCSQTFCTMSCEPETMDCGYGHCEIINGKCEVIWDE